MSEVRLDIFRQYLPLTANVVPRTTVYLDAVDGGLVTAVQVEEGEIVSAGQPLLMLNNNNLHLQVIAAEVQLAEQVNFLTQTTLAAEQSRLRNERELLEIDYQVDRLRRELDRGRPLIPTGGASQVQIDDLASELAYRMKARAAVLQAQRLEEEFRITQIGQLRGTLEAMGRNLQVARANLDLLTIKAPLDGQLTVFDAQVGESKAPGQRIGQVDEQNAFKVSAYVDEFYLTRVTIGQIATVELDSRAHRLDVVKIYPDVRNRQFRIDLQFDGAPPQLVRRGQTLQIKLQIGSPAETLVLPDGAFFDDTGGQWAYVLEESGDYAERRSVRFGRRTPDGIEVLQGLRRGDRVITSSYEHYSNFDRIEFRPGG